MRILLPCAQYSRQSAMVACQHTGASDVGTGAKAAIVPHGEPAPRSVGAAASWMLLAHAVAECMAPTSSLGGHVQDSLGWKRASAGCSPWACGR
jgi:hypothetical protein